MTQKTLMKVEILAYQIIDKEVTQGTKTAGRVYLPKEWIGKKVKICLVEDINDDDEKVS